VNILVLHNILTTVVSKSELVISFLQGLKYQKYYYFNTTNIFTLTFRSLSETFIRRSLFNSSSGSCHDSDTTLQEIGRTCGSACSSPRPSSKITVLFEYVPYCLFDPSGTFVGFSVPNSGGWPIDHVVVMRCMVNQC